jgi:hypothetical protein
VSEATDPGHINPQYPVAESLVVAECSELLGQFLVVDRVLPDRWVGCHLASVSPRSTISQSTSY